MIRMLIVGYAYGIRSERQLREDLGSEPTLVDRLRHSDPGISARSTSHLFVMAQLFSAKGPAVAGLFRLG